MAMNENLEFLTVEEVADILKVSRRTVTNMIKSNRLPARKVGGGNERAFYRILKDDVLKIKDESGKRRTK